MGKIEKMGMMEKIELGVSLEVALQEKNMLRSEIAIKTLSLPDSTTFNCQDRVLAETELGNLEERLHVVKVHILDLIIG